MTRTTRNRAKRILWTCALSSLFALVCASSSAAHNGPPYPIITDQRVGPCIVSLWTHPDVGTGTFFVMVDPLPGGSVPKDLTIKIGVLPESGRLPEVVYSTRHEDLRGQVEFKTEVQFDQQEYWKVRLILTSSAGNGETFCQSVSDSARLWTVGFAAVLAAVSGRGLFVGYCHSETAKASATASCAAELDSYLACASFFV
jgi:hypothetical protein